jgi:hypothetical protein
MEISDDMQWYIYIIIIYIWTYIYTRIHVDIYIYIQLYTYMCRICGDSGKIVGMTCMILDGVNETSWGWGYVTWDLWKFWVWDQTVGLIYDELEWLT